MQANYFCSVPVVSILFYSNESFVSSTNMYAFYTIQTVFCYCSEEQHKKVLFCLRLLLKSHEEHFRKAKTIFCKPTQMFESE